MVDSELSQESCPTLKYTKALSQSLDRMTLDLESILNESMDGLKSWMSGHNLQDGLPVAGITKVESALGHWLEYICQMTHSNQGSQVLRVISQNSQLISIIKPVLGNMLQVAFDARCLAGDLEEVGITLKPVLARILLTLEFHERARPKFLDKDKTEGKLVNIQCINSKVSPPGIKKCKDDCQCEYKNLEQEMESGTGYVGYIKMVGLHGIRNCQHEEQYTSIPFWFDKNPIYRYNGRDEEMMIKDYYHSAANNAFPGILCQEFFDYRPKDGVDISEIKWYAIRIGIMQRDAECTIRRMKECLATKMLPHCKEKMPLEWALVRNEIMEFTLSPWYTPETGSEIVEIKRKIENFKLGYKFCRDFVGWYKRLMAAEYKACLQLWTYCQRAGTRFATEDVEF